jgi:Protein of unknown function (DUF3237)
LEAAVGDPQDLGEISAGHRRIVPLTSGTFSGSELRGTLLPGASANWQIILSAGTALVDVRYTLETERGDLLYVQSRGVRHRSPDVSNVSGAGEDVDAAEYTSLPPERKLLDILACFQVAHGSGIRPEAILMQKIMNFSTLGHLLTSVEEYEPTTWPGTYMTGVLDLRDQWESKLLRTSNWSPLWW